MDLTTLRDTPPWEWPEDAGEMFLEFLRDDRADKSDRLLAAELAGDFTVINDELAHALLSILCKDDESEKVRGRAAISLGLALEYADTDGFDELEYAPISEQTFRRIQETLQKLYTDAGIPKEVRRRVLEASVRAPQDWHRDAVRAAYSSDDEDWNLTAVFSMRFVRGFENQILESLDSTNPDIHYEAVCAAGNWEVDAAWPHIAGLIPAEETDKCLLLAAIEAAANIRPDEASELLVDLTESDDEDIVEAAYEAMGMAQALAGLDWDEEDDDEWLH
jgi:HEAT repeat protein